MTGKGTCRSTIMIAHVFRPIPNRPKRSISCGSGRRFILWVAAIWTLLAVGRSAAAEPFADSPLGPAVAASLASAETGEGADAVTRGNRLASLDSGYDALLLRVHLIRHAQRSIVVQTFIWTNDECGRLMICELIEAARRGVKVRILADSLVSDQNPAVAAFLATAHPNLELRHYRPSWSRLKPTLVHTMLAGLWSFRGINQRMHNKLMVFDDAVMITGGRNIENTYFDHATGLNFRDRDVLAAGPVARAAAESFEEFWRYKHSVPTTALTDVAALAASGKFPRYEQRADYDFGPFFGELEREVNDAALIRQRFADRLQPVEKVTFISDEPGKSAGYFSRTARITRELRGVLAQAETSIVVQTPYLILSKPARKLIRELHKQHPGLSIRISTNSFASTDNIMAYSANYRLRNDYIEDLRLEIHEFRPQPASMPELFPTHASLAELARQRAGEKKVPGPFLCVHAKSLVVDDRVAFIGSYNLDPRSENLNTEVGLLVEDARFARELRGQIERDMRPENAWVIGRRALPLGMQAINGVLDDFLSLAPVDVWPIQNTSSFELKPGSTAVAPWHPDFHRHYREVGSFPGTEGLLTTKEILTRLYKAVGPTLTPIL